MGIKQFKKLLTKIWEEICEDVVRVFGCTFEKLLKSVIKQKCQRNEIVD